MVNHDADESFGETDRRRRSRQVGATVMVAMGVLHFVVPKPFMAIVPKRLGAPRFWTYASGVAEAASGALLLSNDPAQRRAGGWAAAATIAAVYPANIQMAVDAGRPNTPFEWAAWLRLPLQFPMIAWAVGHARAR
ncbi:hypothetical protein [Skermania piniformis]|nr:hypothetical protein [Skermania piniformis]